MRITEYQELARRTCVDLGSSDKNHQHMDLGMVTEIGEILDIFKKDLAYGKQVDIVHLGEETADVAWYVSNKVDIEEMKLNDEQFDIAYDKYFKLQVEEAIEKGEQRDISCVLLLTMLGSFTGTATIFDSPIVVLAGLKAICNMYEVNFEEQLDKNIAKLKTRYPEKFDADKALNRDLDAERKTLEG